MEESRHRDVNINWWLLRNHSGLSRHHTSIKEWLIRVKSRIENFMSSFMSIATPLVPDLSQFFLTNLYPLIIKRLSGRRRVSCKQRTPLSFFKLIISMTLFWTLWQFHCRTPNAPAESGNPVAHHWFLRWYLRARKRRGAVPRLIRKSRIHGRAKFPVEKVH